MATLGLSGPFVLAGYVIDREVARMSPGNYALGHDKNGGTFVVQYVGRSDGDVRGRLHHWLGGKYRAFKYAYATSAKAAFEKECRNYHDFGGRQKLDNDVHPHRPDEAGWRCPVCDIFG